jgi:hypothetical protein
MFILIVKELLIIDEEILVVISFILFVVFTYSKVSSIIALSLDSRSNQIEKALSLNTASLISMYEQYIAFYKQKYSMLWHATQVHYILNLRTNLLYAISEHNLNTNLYLLINNKLATIQKKELLLVSLVKKKVLKDMNLEIINTLE